MATLVHFRRATTHDALACRFGVNRSTATWAIGEVRPLIAERGCTVYPGVRLRTLVGVNHPLHVSGRTGIIDGTEIRVRRPAAGTFGSGAGGARGRAAPSLAARSRRRSARCQRPTRSRSTTPPSSSCCS
nr:transposase family protein [Streptomyces carminius]